MSARKVDHEAFVLPLSLQARTTRLDLPASAVRFHKNGIQFRTQSSIPIWTEMTVALETPLDRRKLTCNGVVVACQGDRHRGYRVSMVFTGLSRQTQARLHALAYTPPA